MTLAKTDIKISMNGRGRYLDNTVIEQLWRPPKYDYVYLHAIETGSEIQAGISKWLTYFNAKRAHSTYGILTPDGAYGDKMKKGSD